MHDWFQQSRLCFPEDFLKAMARSRPEGGFVAVDRVIFPEEQGHCTILDWEAREDTAFHLFEDPLFHCWNELVRHRASRNAVEEREVDLGVIVRTPQAFILRAGEVVLGIDFLRQRLVNGPVRIPLPMRRIIAIK